MRASFGRVHIGAVLALIRIIVVGLLLARPAMALEPPNDALGSAMWFVGEGPSGLPAAGRVAVAAPRAPHATAAAGVGYGFTEAQAGDSGPHHRAFGTLALAVQPLRFLSAAMMFDGRWDHHPDDVLGSSTSAVGEPRIFLRAADAIARGLAVGGQFGVWVPGGEAPSLEPEATTLDAQLLATYAPAGSDLAVSINTGYRLDNSASAIDAPRRLRPGDRLSLALSDSDAVLLGIGVNKRWNQLEALADVTWDILVGNRAPSATESPLRLGIGGRYHVSEAVQVELRPELALSSRPVLGPTEPMSPIEPRFAVVAGLRWVLPFSKPPPDRTGTEAPAITPAAPAVGSVHGRIAGEKGDAIASARVTITVDDTERAANAGADGSFVVEQVPAGPARVVAHADGYEDATVETKVEPGAAATANLTMKRMIKPGQLRGLVRSFNGKPLAATVRVEPLSVEAKTDADGMFQIEVPPGAYEVVIAAPGHAGQRRPVQVEENGVTVLNADLRQGP